MSLFTDWQKKRMNEVWVKSRVGGEHEFAAPKEFFGARLATRNLHPIAETERGELHGTNGRGGALV